MTSKQQRRRLEKHQNYQRDYENKGSSSRKWLATGSTSDGDKGR